MIEAVIFAYITIIALAQIIIDFTEWGYKFLEGAKTFWESGNPLLGVFAIPCFILGALFTLASRLIPLTVRVFPVIVGIWLVLRLFKG